MMLGVPFYGSVIDFMKLDDLTKIFDLGCGFGSQALLFTDNGIGWTGLDSKRRFWSDMYDKENLLTGVSSIRGKYMEGFNAPEDLSEVALSAHCFGYFEEVDPIMMALDFKYVLTDFEVDDYDFDKRMGNTNLDRNWVREYIKLAFDYKEITRDGMSVTGHDKLFLLKSKLYDSDYRPSVLGGAVERRARAVLLRRL